MNFVLISGTIVQLKKIETKDGFHAQVILGVPYLYPSGKAYINRIPCVAFGSICDYLLENIKIGNKLIINGRWSVSSYKDKNDKWVNAHQCIIERIEVIKENTTNEDGSYTEVLEPTIEMSEYISEDDADDIFG